MVSLPHPWQHEPAIAARYIGGIETGRVRQLAKCIGYGLALLIVGCSTCFGGTPIETDQLAPEVPNGSIALILKNRFEMVRLKPGDVITYKKEGGFFIRRVTRISQNEVWISEKTGDGQTVEKAIPLRDIASKMIKHFDMH